VTVSKLSYYNPHENRNDLIPTIISVISVQSDSNMMHNTLLAKRYTTQCECTWNRYIVHTCILYILLCYYYY